MERRIESIIKAEDGGTPLLDYLVRRFTYAAKTFWLASIDTGEILINGKQVGASFIIQGGQSLSFSPSSLEEPKVNLNFSQVYEDDEFLIMNKPPQLPCHPGGPYFKHTLWYQLRESFEVVRIITRLDRETSGLVLCAKSAAAARRAQEMQAEGTLKKSYTVLVHGKFPEKLHARGVLIPDNKSLVRKKRAYREGELEGEGCETQFILRSQQDGLSLVEAELLTGRTHQIRASLCSLGYPLVGDLLYGKDERLFLRFIEDSLSPADRDLLIMDHQALHAEKLRFIHKKGQEQEVRAPLPITWPEWTRV
ncbi:RluA family pseudouridine synthase [Treponema sp.]